MCNAPYPGTRVKCLAQEMGRCYNSQCAWLILDVSLRDFERCWESYVQGLFKCNASPRCAASPRCVAPKPEKEYILQ